jgi:hypothetical protein
MRGLNWREERQDERGYKSNKNIDMYRVQIIYTIANSLQRTKADTQEGRKKGV